MKFEKDYVTKNGNTFHVKLSANRIVFGILFIACAVLIILDAVGISLGFLSVIPAWVFILTVLNLIWLTDVIIKLKLSEIFFPIAFIFMLLEKYIAKWCGLSKSNIINNWLVFLCALLLMIGTKCLAPKRKFTFKFTKTPTFTSKSIHNNSRGSASTIYVDCESDEDTYTIKNELGSCNIYFSNIESYGGNKTLDVHNELGSMQIHVPSQWRIVTSVSNSLGSVSEPEDKGSGDKVIRITGTNDLGSLRITRL